MRTTLEDLYYGNITPCEQQMIPGSELKRAVDRVTKCEEQLMGLLNEEGQQNSHKIHPLPTCDQQYHSNREFHSGFPAGRQDHGRVHG